MPQQFDFPGKKPSMPQINFNSNIIFAGLALLIVLWLVSGIYTVAPDEKAVVLRFGKYQEVVEPGLHFHWPTPIENRLVRSVTKVYREEVGFRTRDPGPPPTYIKKSIESLMLTGDENIIDVEMVIQYRVNDIRKALFNVEGLGVFEGGAGLVHDAAESALRQVVGRHPIDEALTEGKLKIQTEIQDQIQILFDKYECGLSVETVQLQSVGPPQQVDAAFKDVASAKEDKETLVNEALGYKNDIIPKARGEAEKMIKEAEAYKVERTRRSLGDAARFTNIYNEYKKAPQVTEARLYIEAMEKILPDIQKYIVENDGKGNLINLLNLDGKGK